MKLALLCTVLFLAGAVTSSSVDVNTDSIKAWAAEAKLDIPDWVIDLIGRLPEAIQEIIDRIPEIIAAIPGILEQIPAIIAAIIQKIPEIIPIIIEKIPEIIAQIPAAIDVIKEVLLLIIEKLPEVIPIVLEKIREIIDLLPEIIAKIKEILENFELPDWFPDLDKPEWWPELPSLPEYNRPEAGSPATVNNYPSIVQIEVGTGPIWAQGCVGTVLTNFHVLSAARCFSGSRFSNQFRRIRAGASRRYEGGSIVTVASSIIHPNFNNNKDADIAVVRLSNPLILGNTIQQGSIVSQGFVLPDNLLVSTAGWGSTAQGGLISNRDLHEINLISISQSVCAERWGKVPLFQLPSNAVCVGQASTSGRNGDIRDVGSPVYFQGIQVGVVTVGAQMGNQYYPVIATPVGAYTNWIIANAV